MRTALAFALLVAAASSAAAQGALGYDQVLDIALEKSPQLKLSRAAVASAEARERARRALRFPALTVDANLTFWDKALELEIGDIPLPAGTDTTIRDRLTGSVSLTLTQPVTGLLLLSSMIKVETHGGAAARADADASRLDVAARASEAFLRALQAQAGLEIGEKSLAQIEAQLTRARVLEQGGVLGQVDLLRLESARDSARQSVLKARAGTITALRALALGLGLPPDPEITVRDDLPDPPPAPAWDEARAVAAATAGRPELRAARERVEQAEMARRVMMADYFPNVLAVASYQHNEGQGTFQSKDAWYVGLNLHWSLWNWGKTGADVSEAAQRKQQAIVAAGSAADQIVFEARRLALEAATARETLAVSASSLRAAEEAYRIQSVRYQQGAATTTDVLEAETDVARARSAAAVARYDYFISLSALARAAGEVPRF